MTNLTIAVEGDVLRRARIRALEEGSSVNAVLREFLEDYACGDRASRDQAVLRRVAEHALAHPGDSDGRGWSRDDLYAERLAWPR